MQTVDHEARALFHLELLGCYGPADAQFEPPWARQAALDEEPYDDGRYFGEAADCWSCGGSGDEIDCCDDLCHGQGWCMHGGNRRCRWCHGEGVL